jgi:hypothetical protein
MRDACAHPATDLDGIFPGSWINGDFYIWIGHADDHRAWSQLAEARQALDDPGPAADEASRARAREELFIAEGSDWFWWYGDDHSSEHDLEFDDLFRRHLRNVYRALDKPVPDELFLTNITTEPPQTLAQAPSGFLHVTLDGEVTSYFEWLAAGSLELRTTAGRCTRWPTSGQTLTERLLFGFDADHLFLRVDFSRPATDLLVGSAAVQLTFIAPGDTRVRLSGARGDSLPRFWNAGSRQPPTGSWSRMPGCGRQRHGCSRWRCRSRRCRRRQTAWCRSSCRSTPEAPSSSATRHTGRSTSWCPRPTSRR